MSLKRILNISVALSSVMSAILLLNDQLFIGTAIWIFGYALLSLNQISSLMVVGFKNYQNVQIVSRTFFLIGVIGVLKSLYSNLTIFVWISVIVLLLLTFTGTALNQLPAKTKIEVRNFSKLNTHNFPHLQTSIVIALSVALPPIFMGIAVIGFPVEYFVLLLLVPAIFMTYVLFRIHRWREFQKNIMDKAIKELSKKNPKFIVYWSAPSGSAYQISMWMPYFKRMDINFFVLVRNKETITEASIEASGIPVIWVESLTDVDQFIVDSLTTVFYVNNADRNSHMVRHAELKHIQLLHGDSEKTTSYNPVTAMFDRVYVSGQAGIDRYAANNVIIPNSKFRIVGRPQLEKVKMTRETTAPNKITSILYAPTWNGHFTDTAYSSLPFVQPLLKNILDRGIKIVFRPHPYCKSDPLLLPWIHQINELLETHKNFTGIDHVWDKDVEDQSLYDLFNLVDATISDVSSVVTDFLYSGKPLGLTSGVAATKELIASWELSNCLYIFHNNEHDFAIQLDDMLMADPLRSLRFEMRKHYLGNVYTDNYSDIFVQTALNDVLHEKRLSNRRIRGSQ